MNPLRKAGVVLAVGAAALFLAAGACSQTERTETWNEIEYSQDDVRTLDEQLQAQRELQADPSGLGDHGSLRRGEYYSQKMTERERRDHQRKLAEQLQQRAEEQREAERIRREEQREAPEAPTLEQVE